VVGFLPYWEVGGVTPDYRDLTTLAYWAVGLGAGGSIAQSGEGYSTLTSASLAMDVSQAHAAGDRVLLTVFSQSPSVLNSVAAHPSTAGLRLARNTAVLLSAGKFDGVDLDLEGNSTADRDGFVRFVASFSKTLRSLGPTWSIMLDTYPTSALDPLDFFDIKAIIGYVNELFVMAYDMQQPDVASATAPLTNAPWSDAVTLAEYASVVPAQRIVLGIPLYGYDFPAASRFDGAATTGPPLAVTYADIVAAGHPPRWDPVTETPWTVFKRDGKWHQTWFDDPVSIALKSALAAQFHCAGVGVWELGMSGNDGSITEALLGGRLPVKLPLAGA
jgi:spore germination protein YaaH